MNAHPRVLFVTPHAFNAVTGGGITFSNLFRGWPAERLATVHNDPEPTTDDVCRQYYRLGPAELDRVWPLSAARRGATTGGGTAGGSAPATGLARRAVLGVTGDVLPDRGRLTPELEAWIEAFRPDVLYTILGTIGMMQLVDRIRRRFDLPLVVHFMDDWPATAYRGGLIGQWQRRRMLALVQRLVADAAACLAISPAMATAYTRDFGRPFEAFQNTLDVARWSDLATPDPAAATPTEILYVGSVFSNAQLDALIDCAHAVAVLARAGRDVRLNISTPSGHGARYRERLEVHDCVTVEDTITDDDAFFRRIAAADLLLLPVNFDAETVRFIRYSMPTKVPAYLVSGTPVLAYGPELTAQIAYARDAGWAQVVDRPGVAQLSKEIARALDDDVLRRRVVSAAKEAAAANHDASTVRPRFQARLAEAPGLSPATEAVAQ